MFFMACEGGSLSGVSQIILFNITFKNYRNVSERAKMVKENGGWRIVPKRLIDEIMIGPISS